MVVDSGRRPLDRRDGTPADEGRVASPQGTDSGRARSLMNRIPRSHSLALLAGLAVAALTAACGTGSGHGGGGPPSKPTAFIPSPANGQVSLTWAANPPGEVVQSYNLYWGPKSPVGVGYTPNLVTTSTNSAVVSGLTNETTYYFVVTAVNGAGESVRSNETSAVPLHSSAKAIGAGFTHSCAILSDGVMVCWGESATCELGNDCKQFFRSALELDHSNFPVRVDESTPAVEVVAGQQYTCALLSDGTIDCWGAGPSGMGRTVRLLRCQCPESTTRS